MTDATLAPQPASTGSLSERARRLRQFLRWAAPVMALAPVLMLYMFAHTGNTMVATLAFLAWACIPVGLLAHRLAGAERLDAAVSWMLCALWTLAITIGLRSISTAVAVLLVLVPLIAAVPYVSIHALRLLGIAGVGVGATIGIFYPQGDVRVMAEGASTILNSGGVVLIVVFCVMLLWHNRATYASALANLEEANARLRESERTLESRVAARTAELEESEREVERARDVAIEADRQKSIFLSRMSHELRTPLNAIIGFSEVLQDGVFGGLNDKQAEYVGDIHSSGTHLLSLINDVLDLTKIESGDVALQVSDFELSRTVDNAVVLMRERATRQGVTIETDIEPSIGWVLADQRKFKQVLINLLTNAVKFTEAGGFVALRARRVDEGLEVSVRDTGIGISEEDQARIFEDYRQARNEVATSQEGTGLGLALCKTLVEAHGGEIRVTSEVGVGSTFVFTIPDTPAPSDPNDRPS